MLEIDLKFDKKDLQNIRNMPKEFKRGMLKGMRKAMFVVEARAKSRMGTRPELFIQSGHLRRSIQSGVEERAGRVVGWIGTKVIYGRTHELGDPSRNIPKRPYLEPSFEDKEEEIRNLIRNSIIKEVSK